MLIPSGTYDIDCCFAKMLIELCPLNDIHRQMFDESYILHLSDMLQGIFLLEAYWKIQLLLKKYDFRIKKS